MARAATRHLLSIMQAHAPLISHSLRSVASTRWCHSNMLGDSALSEAASKNPGMDFKHWFVQINFVDIARVEGRDISISIEEHIDFYIKTLAKVVGSEEEAKKKIYKVNCFQQYPSLNGIGCEIDCETTNLLKGLPHVFSVTPDYYADPENKDYGGEFVFKNGKLFEKSSRKMLQLQPSSSVLEKPWTELLLSSTPTPSPWLLLPPPAFGEQYDKVYRFYSLAEGKEFSIKRNEEEEDDDEFVGSSNGWLALFRRCNGQLFLSNPLSGQHIKLPSIHNTFGEVGKVITSCSPNSEEEQCRVVMIFGPKNRLAFCCPGHSIGRWTHIGGNSCSNYSDVVYSQSQKLFLCLTDSGRLEGWDLRDPVCPRMVDEHKFDVVANWSVGLLEKSRIHEVKHLVLDKQSEELFIVIRQILRHQSSWGYYVESRDPIYPYATDDFKMYKIDKERKASFCCPETLNGLAMFVGTNHSFALPASEYPELDGECILYTDEKRLIPPNWNTLAMGGPDVDVYNYVHQFFCTRDHGYASRHRFPKHKYAYASDAPLMKRAPPLPMWFTPTLH